MKSSVFGKIATLCFLGTFAAPVFAAVDAPYEVGTWANFCQGAVTHGFDDNMNTNPTAAEQTVFDDKKFHITLHVQTGSVSSWDNCKKSFAKGHEISSHTVSHASSASEIKPSQDAIKKNVPGEMAVTIAYPNCNTPGDAEVLKTYIVGRNCDGKTASSSPTNMAQISAKMFGTCSGCPNDAAGMNSFADAAVSQKGWSVYCHHGIGGQSHSWATTSLPAMKTHLDYLDKNRDKIWMETFGNVARYIKERNAVSITKKDSTVSGMSISVTDGLPDSIFNYPLTIRRPLPDSWKTVAVTQKGKEVFDTIVTVSSKQYIMFNAIPDGGDVLISPSTGVSRQSSRSCSAGISPVSLQKSTLLINPSQFNGSNLTVSLFDLTGKLLMQQSLKTGESRIALPTGKINQSAFVAKISGGGNTWSGMFMPQM